ncbi:hypothetical protein Hanom_Chr08g00711361 [Helianthus anomalus]
MPVVGVTVRSGDQYRPSGTNGVIVGKVKLFRWQPDEILRQFATVDRCDYRESEQNEQVAIHLDRRLLEKILVEC